jgi:CheY-like chemotaxis protein
MIILAEDDADHRLALKLALQLGGYTVREAANGREALALQRRRPSRSSSRTFSCLKRTASS